MIADVHSLVDILICPRCRAPLTLGSQNGAQCRTCGHFPQVDGKPVLVDFDASILDRDSTLATAGASVVTRHGALMTRLFRIVNGTNPITPRYASKFLNDCRALATADGRRARLLIVGGGSIGDGADNLYAAEDVELVSIDIYASPNVTLLADGHSLPLADDSIDGVWIQAVLEHVVDPNQVVSEIVRVLRPGGLVFADTPFMWPVHEGAWDFTRWTASGHRWLFRDFEVLAAGRSHGPGTAALLALRYLVASLTRSTKLGQLLTAPFIWLRVLDRWCAPRKGIDAAAHLYFYGHLRPKPLSVKEIVPFYGQQIPIESESR